LIEHNKKQFKPKNPIMVWDGECDFCRLCADRFKSLKKDDIEFISYQEIFNKYPKAPEMDYKKSVVFFTNKNIYTGAAAVFGYYNEIGKKFPLWLYNKIKIFEKTTEYFYQVVANNRSIFQSIGQLFLGSNYLPDTYKISGWIYGRLLGFVGLIAFLSFWSQSDILISSEGIVPFESDLRQIEGFITKTNTDISKWFARPTILWLSQNDLWLDVVLLLGTLASISLTIGLAPHISIAVSWMCYLSISSVSEPFLNFQWDTLLLETYLLSIFFVPWKIFDDRKNIQKPSQIGKWLLWLLIIKLMVESGLVKLTFFGSDGSNTWRDLTALNYHYWTQPIPSWISWYIDKLPEFIDKIALAFTYCCELIIPFMIFFPRRIRRVALCSLIIFQVLIIATGNYGFFNLLTIVICVTLIDDQLAEVYLRKWFSSVKEGNGKNLEKIKLAFGLIILSCFIYTTVFFISRDLKGNKANANQGYNDISSIGRSLIQTAQVTRSMNAYGLFRVMTVTRPEIYIEALSSDSMWRPIIFNYKPVEPGIRPKFFFPHMPRIDWQMWFEALYFERLIENPFALSAYQRFLENMVAEDLKMGEVTINNFIKNEDRKILESLPFAERQKFTNNLEQSINSHLNNSYWFARFLSKLSRQEPIMKDAFQFGNISDIISLRISLYQYSFTDGDSDENNWWKIETGNSPSIIIDIK
tara:strand:+ start:1280 stop:3367 length:2088 start_codon:yes stop_codon:yes gene_type:complete